MPAPVLDGCTAPPVEGAPDLRGTWWVVDTGADGQTLPRTARLWRLVERIEQASDRVVVPGRLLLVATPHPLPPGLLVYRIADFAPFGTTGGLFPHWSACLLYTSDAADEEDS